VTSPRARMCIAVPPTQYAHTKEEEEEEEEEEED
jgi:hypothetical protein